MKFHTTDFYTFDGNPRPWVDLGLNERDTIEWYFDEFVKVWDADICGDETVEFVFENGRAFRLEYFWYIEHDPEWHIVDGKEIEEIPLSEYKGAMKRYRDIIGVGPNNAILRKYIC